MAMMMIMMMTMMVMMTIMIPIIMMMIMVMMMMMTMNNKEINKYQAHRSRNLWAPPNEQMNTKSNTQHTQNSTSGLLRVPEQQQQQQHHRKMNDHTPRIFTPHSK